MKRILKCIALLLVVVLAFTGCASKNTSKKETDEKKILENDNLQKEEDKEPVTLTLWHESEDSIVQVLEEQLAKLEPDIKVKIVRKEQMTDALKIVAGDPNSAPDLIWYAHDGIGMFAEMGVFEPIDDYVEADTFDNFIPLTEKAVTYNGKHYQVPVYYETLMFMYNKALLDKAPSTTDELLKMMKEKTADGHYGFVEQHSTAYYASAWIHAFGGFIINDKAEPGLNSQNMIDATDYHKKFIKYMPADGEWNTVTTLFLEGKAASIVNGPWFVSSAKDAGIDLGVAPLPTVSENGNPLQPYSGVQGISLVSTSKNKEVAKKVLNFLCQKDLSEALSIKNGAAPAHKDAYENPEIQNDEIIMTLKECAENAIPMPNIPETEVMWSCTENALAAINKSGADTKKTLEDAQKEALSGIESMK